MTRQILLAEYDGTSRIPGTSLGASALWSALSAYPQAPRWQMRRVREETKSSALWCRKLRSIAERSSIDLALGGEHLISFPLLEALTSRHPGLRLVVLDAHHDAYDYPLLTHYSLFHYTHAELGIPAMMLGVRHEIEKATTGVQIVSAEECRRMGLEALRRTIHDFVAGNPFYFSIDLDVLDPQEFAAVSDAVAGGLSVSEVVELARAVFACAPVAVDLVEYNPLRDPERRCLERIAPLLEELACWLG